jgi:hypothetical protein
MSFSFDFSQDKPDIREPIPAGTRVLVRMNYTPGGAGPGGALTKSKPPGDTEYLKAEFTVLRGPYKGRKFWSNFTTSGGKLDEKGRSIAGGITRQNIRMIIDGSQGLSSKDDSPQAAAKRVLPNGFADLQGRTFVAKVKVEAASGNYPAKNALGQILTIDHADYPKSEADLDGPAANPVQAALPTAAAPTWAAAAPAAAPVVQPTVEAAPIVVPPAALPAATVAPVVAAAVTGQSNGALPAWMQG